MVQCCANGCTAPGRHLFPRESTRRKQWEIVTFKEIGVGSMGDGFKISNHSRLCGAHLKSDEYISESFFSSSYPLMFLKSIHF